MKGVIKGKANQEKAIPEAIQVKAAHTAIQAALIKEAHQVLAEKAVGEIDTTSNLRANL